MAHITTTLNTDRMLDVQHAQRNRRVFMRPLLSRVITAEGRHCIHHKSLITGSAAHGAPLLRSQRHAGANTAAHLCAGAL